MTHPLRPKSVTYNRQVNGTMQTVNGTVHVADREPTSSSYRHSNDSNADRDFANRPKTAPALPEGLKYTSFISDAGKENIKNFIQRNYGEEGRTFHFGESAKFFGIVDTNTRRIVAAGEVQRTSWHTSEMKHAVVDPMRRGQNLGSAIIAHLEDNVSTPVATLTTKLPQVKSIVERAGYDKQTEVRGPSGDMISIYNKTL